MKELHEQDAKVLKVYAFATRRIDSLLRDKEHFMNGKMRPITAKVHEKAKQSVGRVDVFRRLVQAASVATLQSWRAV